jgi:hypothetical protein
MPMAWNRPTPTTPNTLALISQSTGRAQTVLRLGEPSPNPPVRGRFSPGAAVSALHGSRQGFQDPLAAPLPHAYTPARTEPLHGQSILEVLQTKLLTAPAPDTDRRLSGEGHQVGGHSRRSDHEQHGSLHSLPGRRLDPPPGCTCVGNAHSCIPVVCTVCGGSDSACCVPDGSVKPGADGRSRTGRDAPTT